MMTLNVKYTSRIIKFGVCSCICMRVFVVWVTAEMLFVVNAHCESRVATSLRITT
jgi:hypothetical protein